MLRLLCRGSATALINSSIGLARINSPATLIFWRYLLMARAGKSDRRAAVAAEEAQRALVGDAIASQHSETHTLRAETNSMG